jgi:DNA-binding beta-propeller fold protein YncE
VSYQTIFRSTLILAMAAAGIAGASGGALAATPSSSLTIVDSSLPFADVVINPASTFAYFTVPTKNEVAVLNLETATFGKPIPVGSDPEGIDIGSGGKYLFVADSGGQTISKVNIATGKVKTIITPAGSLDDTPYSIVVLDNDTALYSTTFEGSGFGANVYSLNLSTDVSTEVSSFGLGGQVTEVTQMSRSWNHAVAGAVLGDDSGGPFDIYTAATGNVVSGSLDNFIGFGSLNGTGTTFLVDGSYVIDAATGTLLGTISDDCVGAVLNRSGGAGYCLESGALVDLRVRRFLTGASTALPSGVTGTGELAISPNGDLLVGITSAGALIDSI